MALNDKKSRATLRKKMTYFENKKTELFLYGKLKPKRYAVAYYKLHKCYLEPLDIKEKKCNFKRCRYIKEL